MRVFRLHSKNRVKPFLSGRDDTVWCARIRLAAAGRSGWKGAKLEVRQLAQRAGWEATGRSLPNLVVVGDGEKWVDLRAV